MNPLDQLCLKPAEASADFIISPHYHPEAEWPLIIYTVSLQAAVGTVFAGLLWTPSGRTALENLILTLALGAVGLLGATCHLASPLRAPRAILNWRRSWLSREILFSAAFMGVVFVAGLMYLLPGSVDSGSNLSVLAGTGLRGLAGLTGVVLLGAMGMSYLAPTRPTWNHRDTLAGFYSGAFQLGWVVSAVLFFLQVQRLPGGVLVLISGGLIILTVLRIYVVFRIVERLRNLPLYRDQSCSWLTGNTLRIRIILAVTGGIVAPLCGETGMLLSEGYNLPFIRGVWITAALLLIMGEGIDRWIFFKASPVVIFPPRF